MCSGFKDIEMVGSDGPGDKLFRVSEDARAISMDKLTDSTTVDTLSRGSNDFSLSDSYSGSVSDDDHFALACQSHDVAPMVEMSWMPRQYTLFGCH